MKWTDIGKDKPYCGSELIEQLDELYGLYCDIQDINRKMHKTMFSDQDIDIKYSMALKEIKDHLIKEMNNSIREFNGYFKSPTNSITNKFTW